jgi:hypothetical protein
MTAVNNHFGKSDASCHLFRVVGEAHVKGNQVYSLSALWVRACSANPQQMQCRDGYHASQVAVPPMRQPSSPPTALAFWRNSPLEVGRSLHVRPKQNVCVTGSKFTEGLIRFVFSPCSFFTKPGVLAVCFAPHQYLSGPAISPSVCIRRQLRPKSASAACTTDGATALQGGIRSFHHRASWRTHAPSSSGRLMRLKVNCTSSFGICNAASGNSAGAWTAAGIA